MSKITYLWGAGASFGMRLGREQKPDEDYIVRGVPVISEFENAIDDIIRNINKKFSVTNSLKVISDTNVEILLKKLQALKQICKDFPTVDTYAKQLAVTGAYSDYPPIKDYDDLKDTLSLFLTMIQLQKNRDPRYDGFIASVISNQGEMPPMTILSWNYDVQFELAYSGYALAKCSYSYIPYQWHSLNVLNKTYRTKFSATAPFAMIKLNGSATFESSACQNYDNCIYKQMKDPFFGHKDKLDSVDYALDVMQHQYKNHLSYIWEDRNLEEVKEMVSRRVADTEELIVIGYSFPYVNRTLDEEVLCSMPLLKKIWIQDPNFEEIDERVKSMLPEDLQSTVKIVPVYNRSQFKLPSSFN